VVQNTRKTVWSIFFDHVWVIQWRRFAFSINNVGIIDNPYAKKNLKTQNKAINHTNEQI